MQNYRDSMEAAMAQVVEVLAAHEAELASLRERVAALEAEQNDP